MDAGQSVKAFYLASVNVRAKSEKKEADKMKRKGKRR
jgi:hypothetical protein